jgi:ABC-type multidrug transport system fused ATPase/permease subunit
MKSDLVMVLADGALVECGSPETLMRDADSEFSKMLEELKADSELK